MNIANVASFLFDQIPATGDITGIANSVYETPADLQLDLGQITRLNYLDAILVGSVIVNAAESVLVADVRLTDGVNDYYTETGLVFTAATRVDFVSSKINLKNVNGSTPLYLALDVTTAATVAVTAQLYGQLRIEFPTTIAG